MTHLLIVVLDDLDCLPELLQVWQKIGVPGTTILESVGAHRARIARAGRGAGAGQPVDPAHKNVQAWFEKTQARPSAQA